jgi:hypothetical protein
VALTGDIASPLTHSTSTATSSTSTFTTTETLTDTITVTLVSGETYLVEHSAIWNSSTAGDYVAIRLREDNASGTVLNGVDLYLQATARYPSAHVRAYYTAVASGSKTLVVTGQRAAGSGNVMRAASSANPSVLSVTQVP